eukprot:8807133-Lingulodinium_polyedra.AAC.1
MSWGPMVPVQMPVFLPKSPSTSLDIILNRFNAVFKVTTSPLSMDLSMANSINAHTLTKTTVRVPFQLMRKHLKNSFSADACS